MSKGMNPGIKVPDTGEASTAVRTAIQQIIKKIGMLASPIFSGLTISGLTGVLKATAGVISGSAAHSDLAGVTANQHHNQAHTVDGADHTASGLTTGHVLTATGPTAFAFQALPAGHAQQHAITSTADHTSTATSGKMLKADANGLPVDATNTDAQVSAAVTASHAQNHAIDGASHTASGLTTGHVLTATGATTFAFQAPVSGVTKVADQAEREALSPDYGDLAYQGDTGILYLYRAALSENFTGYTEADPGADITVTVTTITWVNLEARNSESYVYKDYGAGHFSGDFTHKLKFKFTSSWTSLALANVWGLANVVDDMKGIDSGTNDAIGLAGYNNGTNHVFVLRWTENGSATGDTSVALSVGTDYYITITRDDNGGTNGTGLTTCYICTGDYYGEAGATLIDTLTYNASAGEQNDFRYLYATNVYNDSSAGKLAHGVVSSLEIGEATGNWVTITTG